jgi:CheY-like chemotaxis protein/anti-sigma regulatory factor (Ser/Thr protein kinase)
MTGLDLLDQSGPPTPELAKVQPAMRRQVYHLVRLVDDLLDVSRITSGKIELRREWVKPQEVVDRAVEMSRPGIDSQHHTLTVNVAKDWGELRIHGDPVRLAQVISNLLNNAARYTDQGGRILLTCVREAEGVLFRVVDDGHGMTAALVERVFDMFVQGRPGGGGLGIGLTLVSRMVELHGGYTRAHSAGPGHGSTFEVWIPMSEPRAVTIPSPTADPDWSMMPRLRVGLVEDNEDIREMTRMLVMGWGHEVVGEAGTASEGIEMLCAQRPDVAIVDIGLPDSNGFEVAKAICKSLGEQRPRLIAVSGFSQPQDRKMSAEAGFDEHLTKPVRDNILRRALIPR